ncbi:MAG: NADP-dependent isocitrate dehydrogenase [Fimbriimonas sp.]
MKNTIPITPIEPHRTSVAVAFGDGIGPEIMAAVLRILGAAGAPLAYEPIEVGEAVYRKGVTSGIDSAAWDAVRRNKVLLKAPITTPQGGGVKSLNVTLRKSLGLFANVRPCPTYAPFVATGHPGMNVVIVRENEEDLYAGIEHRHTDEVVQCLKLMSRPGCERIARFAFEYARAHGRRKVTCITKDNIMKLTDGLFHRVFEEIAEGYPDIESEHMIVDIGAARLATQPTRFDVILAPNLYGDILSDIAAEVAGSIGLAASANVGENLAMFEAVHGSAPDIAGKDVANPSGLLLAAVMMLVHIGQPEIAAKIHNAWLRTIEDGIHTPDIYHPEQSRVQVGTQAFADAVVLRLGQTPDHFSPVEYRMPSVRSTGMVRPTIPAVKECRGIDVFVDWKGSVSDLAARLLAHPIAPLTIQMITNRGVQVWPQGFEETLVTDHWRCRFMSEDRVGGNTTQAQVSRLVAAGLEVVKTEGLYTFDGRPGYSLGQGQ